MIALANDLVEFIYALRWLFTGTAFLILTMAYIEQGNQVREQREDIAATRLERDLFKGLAQERRRHNLVTNVVRESDPPSLRLVVKCTNSGESNG